MSFFDSVTMVPEDPIFGFVKIFDADSRLNKVNLGIGVYRDGEGKPVVLSCVRKAEKIIVERNLTKEYLPIEGDPEYLKELRSLLFGDEFLRVHSERICTVQTTGGSGALRIGGEFLSLHTNRQIFIPKPSWPNHDPLLKRAGMLIKSYPYYRENECCLDFSAMCQAIVAMEPGSVILLHGCCHNPTGVDPSKEQWKELSDLIKKQKLIPFFDLAYQGFGKDEQEDAFAIRYFAEQGHEMFVASSCSKNFCLYGERIGGLSIVAKEETAAQRIKSQIKQLIRESYSNPPRQGARIISTILGSPPLKKEWVEELARMRKRIEEMRHAFFLKLSEANQDRDFNFINQQSGFFSMIGLNRDQVDGLKKEKGIYLIENGRINIAGLNWKNIDVVVEAIQSCHK